MTENNHSYILNTPNDSDYTGSGFKTIQQAEAKCNSRDMAGTELSPLYSTLFCRERSEEIEDAIPDYQGHTGTCVVHCQKEDEFIWNIYTENPEESCGVFGSFYLDDVN